MKKQTKELTAEEQLDRLQEYMNVYCQLVGEIDKVYLPSFDYFNEHYNDSAYSLAIPHYRDAWIMGMYNTPRMIHEHGMGNDTCGSCGRKGFDKAKLFDIKYYNYWNSMGKTTFQNGLVGINSIWQENYITGQTNILTVPQYNNPGFFFNWFLKLLKNYYF